MTNLPAPIDDINIIDLLAERLANPNEIRHETDVGGELGLDGDQVHALLRKKSFQDKVMEARENWVHREAEIVRKIDTLAMFNRLQAEVIKTRAQHKANQALALIEINSHDDLLNWRNGDLGALLGIMKSVVAEKDRVVVQTNVNAGLTDLTDAQLERAMRQALKEPDSPSPDGAGKD